MSDKQYPEDPEAIRSAILRRRAEQLAKSPEARAEEERLWRVENAEAFQSMNEWVERYGMPLQKYRPF